MTKAQIAEQNEFIAKLRAELKPGDTIYTLLRHVSSSGMSRIIDCQAFKCVDGKLQKSWYTGWIAKACGWKIKSAGRTGEGLSIGGCGMDMGFHVVYTLSRILFPDGFGITGKLNGRKVTPKSKEHAKKLCAKGAEFSGRNGDSSGWDNDGGYALKQEWI